MKKIDTACSFTDIVKKDPEVAYWLTQSATCMRKAILRVYQLAHEYVMHFQARKTEHYRRRYEEDSGLAKRPPYSRCFIRLARDQRSQYKEVLRTDFVRLRIAANYGSRVLSGKTVRTVQMRPEQDGKYQFARVSMHEPLKPKLCQQNVRLMVDYANEANEVIDKFDTSFAALLSVRRLLDLGRTVPEGFTNDDVSDDLGSIKEHIDG